MNNFTTLNAIITDLMDIIRGSEVARTEPISEVQVEGWIHQYRAKLIKQALDKGRLINPDYVQTLSGLELEANGDEYQTVEDIPNTVFRSFEDGYTWIGSDGIEYHYMTEQRSQWNSYRKYTSVDPYVYLTGKKLVGNTDGTLDIKGIFENPMEVIRFDGGDGDTDSVYPMPADMIPVLKEMILKGELAIEAETPSDSTNNSEHDIK